MCSRQPLYLGRSGVASQGLQPGMQVFWYNSETDELVPCATKSLKVEMAAEHSGGVDGWRADAFHEVEALRRVAGVSGVVGYRDIIEERTGAIHIILECVSLSCPAFTVQIWGPSVGCPPVGSLLFFPAVQCVSRARARRKVSVEHAMVCLLCGLRSGGADAGGMRMFYH
jgi:hypothetical protein